MVMREDELLERYLPYLKRLLERPSFKRYKEKTEEEYGIVLEADDLLQEMSIELLQATRKKQMDEKEIKTFINLFLYGIAVRHVRDASRQIHVPECARDKDQTLLQTETASIGDVGWRWTNEPPKAIIIEEEAVYGMSDMIDQFENLIYWMHECLTDNERKVLVVRFGLNDGYERTLQETGKLLGMSCERVRNIEAKAMRKLYFHLRKRNS